MSTIPKTQRITPGAMISAGLFIAFIVALGAFYLFIDFRGLTSKHGIDQAQISREFSRGNGLTTKFLRPFSLYQAEQQAQQIGGRIEVDRFEDTYHAPLGVLANALALTIFEDKTTLSSENRKPYSPEVQIYPADRVIAGTSVVFFILAIGVFYYLTSRIFDRRIGLTVAFLLIFCESLWRFAQTGLPTSLLLLLFGLALLFLYRAVENQTLERSPWGWALLSAAFFGLLALTHWITIWIFLGALVFAALALRPRGGIAASMGIVFLLVILPGLIRNYIITGTLHGDAFYALYNGLGALGESGTMRNFRPDSEFLNLQGFGGRIAVTSLSQLKQLTPFMGAILAAPIFFLSLLHSFKRPEISIFRWALLSMWILAVVGMAIFGLPDGERDTNQMHILFAPAMAAYGLAMLAVLWNRLGIAAATNSPFTRNLPYIVLVLLSALPMIATVPRTVFRPGVFQEIPNYPPYLPSGLVYLNTWTNDEEILVTDMPWGTAWYSDRLSCWLPRDISQFEELDGVMRKYGFPVGGIYFSPITGNARLGSEIVAPGSEYADWAYYILRPQFEYVSQQAGRREGSFRFGVFMPMAREMGFWTNFNRAERGRPGQESILESEDE